MFTDNSYSLGQQKALEKIAEQAGPEFAEKVAGMYSKGKDAITGGFRAVKNKVQGKMSPKKGTGYSSSTAVSTQVKEAPRAFATSTSKSGKASDFKKKFTDYHQGGADNFRAGFSGKRQVRYKDGTGKSHVQSSENTNAKLSFGERMKNIGKGAAKFTPHAAAVGGAGYAGKKGYDSYYDKK